MIDLEYNTQRGKMIISEYGRNIQHMIELAVIEQDLDKRNRMVQELITLMGQLNPHLRDVADYKHKLYDHLFIMSDFKLDIESPYTKPTRESVQIRPEPVPYPQNRIRYRFYGKNVEFMIQQAREMEEGPMKKFYINQIGSFMKNSCRNWNDEKLTDEQIWQHLYELSGGKIQMTEENAEDGQFNSLPAARNVNAYKTRTGFAENQGKRNFHFKKKNNFNRNGGNGSGNGNNGNNSGNGNSGNTGGTYRNFRNKPR